jgi:hypothetical protein
MKKSIPVLDDRQANPLAPGGARECESGGKTTTHAFLSPFILMALLAGVLRQRWNFAAWYAPYSGSGGNIFTFIEVPDLQRDDLANCREMQKEDASLLPELGV